MPDFALRASPLLLALGFILNKCSACGKKVQPKYLKLFGSTIASEFGFQVSMIILGGYVAACFYTIQSLTAVILAALIGAAIFYFLQGNSPKYCEKCSTKKNKNLTSKGSG